MGVQSTVFHVDFAVARGDRWEAGVGETRERSADSDGWSHTHIHTHPAEPCYHPHPSVPRTR